MATNKLGVFLSKKQSVTYVPETSLITEDVLECMVDSKLETTYEVTEHETLQGYLGQNAAIPGAATTTAELVFPMRVIGPDAYDKWGDLLECSGMNVTTTEPSTGNFKYVFKMVDTSKAMTLWYYSGSTVASESVLTKAGNMMFDVKVSGDINKPAYLTFSGKGTLIEVPSAATKPSVSASLLSAVTPSTNPLVNHAVLGSNSYRLLKFEISANNTVEQRLDGTKTFGYGQSEITDRKVRWSVQVYSTALDTVDPYTALKNSTTGSLLVSWGPIGRAFRASIGGAQITSIKESTSGNIVVWDIEGISQGNAFEIAINNDIT